MTGMGAKRVAANGLAERLAGAKAFRRKDDGLALTEFALVFPIMIFMFIGLVEFGEAFTVNRKINTAAGTVSDLVSQESMVNCAQLQDVSTIATEIIKPYRTAPFTLRIISVVADENNQPKVSWTYPEGALAAGSNYTNLPNTGMTEPNSSLIIAETSYAFTPSVGYFIGSITLNGVGYFRPRLTPSVEKAACG
jgi:Flp pilus assembly protein TadG